MNTETMITELKAVADKHRNDKHFTFETNITAMCKDIIPKLEQLAEYEAIGTVEELEQISRDLKRQIEHSERLSEVLDSTKNLLKKRENILNKYYEIGTVEEFRKLKEEMNLKEELTPEEELNQRLKEMLDRHRNIKKQHYITNRSSGRNKRIKFIKIEVD